MLHHYLNVLTPLVGLAINVSAQIASLRCFLKMGLVKSICFGFITGFLIVFVLTLYIFLNFPAPMKDFIAVLITNLIIYSALGYCYFHFINLGETARRIRVLREIYDSGSGLSMDEMLERYNAKEITKKRLDRLLNNKQIVYKNGKYFIASPIMLFMAKTVVLMKLIFLGKKSEFD